ncbi:PREDICTED: leucine-rich repeat and fibronectin type-III domain-containing protein 3-like [Branchiostoma belcheri]|uniref:Leucine-rich repeat and fibronectin type-III domain-containing protein 3-like n=1 Tax=Branchiostoma belcheri TaxID=7741 RepID=A0A6P4ZFK5_BRABE|nr:PREDICTED: leucine-rich repeat and fibronectin type-III domain-containing protein 3-like [Branchiostoma belcheri]
MQELCHLDLSYNRLKEFPWSSLRNISHLTELKLNNNELSKVDDFVQAHHCIRYLHLQSNRITAIPESFLNGFRPINPPRNTFFLRIHQNPFLCDYKIQWIARLRRCVWEHRDEGCIDAPLSKVRTCMLSNCNFHPIIVILDMREFRSNIILLPSENTLLRCDSPQELRGKLLKDVTLPTCASPSASLLLVSPSISGLIDDTEVFITR